MTGATNNSQPSPSPYLGDPEAFAEAVLSRVGAGDPPPIAAQELAYADAFAAVLAEMGIDRPPGGSALAKLEDTGHELSAAVFDHGVRVGVAAEHLRRALAGA